MPHALKNKIRLIILILCALSLPLIAIYSFGFCLYHVDAKYLAIEAGQHKIDIEKNIGMLYSKRQSRIENIPTAFSDSIRADIIAGTDEIKEYALFGISGQFSFFALYNKDSELLMAIPTYE